MVVRVLEYDDDDDYGVPTLRPLDSRTRTRLTLRRYRVHILIAIIVLLAWWYRSRIPRSLSSSTDWSRFAYVQYATDVHSMCNALMVFESLHRLGSKADRVLLFPREWNDQEPDATDRTSQMLWAAQKGYGVKMQPIQVLGVDGPADPGTIDHPSDWGLSITKLRAFELEQYDRVLHIDSDVTIQNHMDELFSLPSAPVAMPRMYWEEGSQRLTSLIMLIEPNAAETRNMYERLQEWRRQPDHSGSQKYDMDLLNDRFGSSAMVLPHRPYALLTSEFRNVDHSAYLGTKNGPPNLPAWDAYAALKEAKVIHFSDWPLPKPWRMWPSAGLIEMQPTCGGSFERCPELHIWKGLYDDFRKRRKDVCRILSVPAPHDWEEYKKTNGWKPAGT